MKTHFLSTVFFFVLPFFVSNSLLAAEITNYHATYLPGFDLEGRLVIGLRIFDEDRQSKVLIVDVASLETRVISTQSLRNRRSITQADQLPYLQASDIEQSAYGQARKLTTSGPVPLQNAGLTKAIKPVDGMFVTIDLCPSSKVFEAAFFQSLVARSLREGRPVEIALCLSGLWALLHEEELQWILRQQKENRLHVTWVNHSLSHLYFSDLPFEENFMLHYFTHFEHEVLATEEILLAQGEVPSIFFRYPGLVANAQSMSHLARLGLIPLGADAWLAKGEQPGDGSIILVHGNSNEPAGIKIIMPWVDNPNGPAFLPLTQALR